MNATPPDPFAPTGEFTPPPSAPTGVYTPMSHGGHAATATRLPAEDRTDPETCALPAAPPAAPAAELPRVPGYEVIAQAGRGGMGIVYQARHLALNRLVALKMVRAERADGPEQLLRFRFEAEMAARVRHPNVVPVYESGAWQGNPYLVLEWIDGGTLADWTRATPQSPTATARTVELLARAVHACHLHGIVHRDFKPHNVLMARPESATGTDAGRDGTASVRLVRDGRAETLTPKITDFGLAKQLTGGTFLTQTGSIMGTPEYMAPEQARGDSDAVGPAVDTYALGVTLYQMLVGETPFTATSPPLIIHRLLEEEPTAPRAVDATIPRDLETICLKCLEKDPARRYGSAEQLADDLQRFVEGRPIHARPTTPAERVAKWAKRQPAVAALIVASLSLFLGGVGGIARQWQVAEANAARAEQAERAAVADKAAAEAVNRFLVGEMLAAAAPEKSLGRAVTVEEVLRDAAARVPGAFPEQPLIEASVRQALGNSFRRLGLFADAETHLAAAIGLRERHLGGDHADTRAAIADRAVVWADLNRWGDAESELRRLLVAEGGETPLGVELAGRLALVVSHRGDRPAAERLFADALATARRLFGPNDPRTLTILNDQGALLVVAGKPAEAERAFRESAAGRAELLTPRHPAALESRQNLALALAKLHRRDEARALLTAVLADKRAVLGPQHIDTLSAMNNLALLLQAAGDFEGALTLHADLVAGFTAKVGADNPLTLTARCNRGQLLLAMAATDPDDMPKAEADLTAALAGRRKALSAGHPDVLLAAAQVAKLHRLSRKPTAAAAVCAEAWAEAERADTTGTPEGVSLGNVWVESLLAQKPKPALAGVLGRAERVANAAQSLAATSDEGRSARRTYGALLLEANRPADAEPHLRAVWEGNVSQSGPKQLRTALDAAKLGACLTKLTRYADAEPLLLAAHDALRSLPDTPRQVIDAVSQQVLHLYEAWGKPEKAEAFRRR